MTRASALATIAALLTGAFLVVALACVIVATTTASLVTFALGVAVAPLAATLGLVLTRHPTASRVGVLLALFGLVLAIVVCRETGTAVLARDFDTAADLAWLVAATSELAVWVLASAALLLLHFPDGRTPGRRWRWLPFIVVAGAGLVQLHGAFDTTPFRPPLERLVRPFGPAPLWLEVAGLAGFLAVLLGTVASAVSLLARYRTADRRSRAQIKWLAVGGFGLALYPFVCGIEIVTTGTPGWISAIVGVAGLVGIPIAVAIATLRHDLYDVDKAFAGTVAWTGVSVGLLAIYATVAFAVGVVVGQGSAAAAAAAAVGCALALSPLRRRLGSVVDRRLYAHRRAAFDAIDGLHRDVGLGLAQPEALQAVLRAALRDDSLVVGYRLPGGEGFVDHAGLAVAEGQGTVIDLQGMAIGVLVPSRGASSSGLLREIGARATALVEVVRLRLELGRALREVEASRARLVQIGYEERRRLERDLHDGAQQRLVSLGLAIRLAQRHLGDGSVNVAGLLDDTVAQLSEAVGELRLLAQGIRPSSLDDGLEAALARLVKNVPMEIEAEVVAGPLPDDVATTAYFVVSEAVANAVKHANASRIGLLVSREAAQVIVRVSDDGRGGAILQPRSGMADRVAALGGSLNISSPVGRGTIVEVALPCAS